MTDAQTKEQLNRIERDVTRTLTLLEGTDADPEKGLMIRVDRIEQRQKITTWFARATLGLTSAGLVKFLAGLIHH